MSGRRLLLLALMAAVAVQVVAVPMRARDDALPSAARRRLRIDELSTTELFKALVLLQSQRAQRAAMIRERGGPTFLDLTGFFEQPYLVSIDATRPMVQLPGSAVALKREVRDYVLKRFTAVHEAKRRAAAASFPPRLAGQIAAHAATSEVAKEGVAAMRTTQEWLQGIQPTRAAAEQASQTWQLWKHALRKATNNNAAALDLRQLIGKMHRR